MHGPGDAAPELATGLFDVILCHGVLIYLDNAAPMRSPASPKRDHPLTAVRNGLATAMCDGIRGRWNDALAAFDNRHYVNRLGLAAVRILQKTSTRG